jgi:hypothetical protein
MKSYYKKRGYETMPAGLESSAHIFIASHLPLLIPQNAFVSVVKAGSSDSSTFIGQKDTDTKDNISYLNPMYCELTVQYMLLASGENSLPEKIGFMHYRRFLIVANPFFTIVLRLLGKLPNSHWLYTKRINLCLEPRRILKAVKKADLVIPKATDVRTQGFRSVREHYANYHFESDWEACGQVIKDLHPELSSEFENLDSNSIVYIGNIYIMSKTLFLEYGRLLFKILERVRVAIDFSNRTIQETRALGYLAERIFTAYVELKRKEGKITIMELPLARIDPPINPTLNKAE